MTDMLPREDLDGLMDEVGGLDVLGPVVRDVVAHLCAGPPGCRAIGIVAEWCDAADDAYLIVCPGCGARFAASEADLGELRRWTDAEGSALVCGITWD